MVTFHLTKNKSKQVTQLKDIADIKLGKADIARFRRIMVEKSPKIKGETTL